MQPSFSKLWKKRKGFLVCFCGVDGSGKTSHAKSLLNYLCNQGYSCTYMSGKTKLLLSCFFYGLTRLLGYWKKLETEDGIYSIYPLGLAAKNLREKLNSLLRVFFFIDFQIKILWEVRLPLIFGKVVICDRYVYDIIAGLMEDDLNTETFYKFVLQTTPIPQLVFLTDTSKEVLSTRRRISMNILDKKRKAYLILAYSNDFFVLDSSDDFEKNQHKVRQVSLSQLSGKNHAMRGK